MTRPSELIHPSPLDYLNGLKEDDLIHRYCSIAELYSIVRERLTLTCPFAWDDLFENPLMRAKLTSSKGEEIDLKAAGRRLFCQSWTLNDEADGMWKLYGNRGTGVRISARAKDLYFHAYNSHDFDRNEAVITKIGRIKYIDELELRNKFENEAEFVERFMKLNCEGYYESLLYKRKAYAEENEVRLIAHDFDSRFSCQRTLRLELPTKGHDWIENVTLGPAIDIDTAEAHCDRLTNLGFPKEKIKASTLYGALEYTINLKR